MVVGRLAAHTPSRFRVFSLMPLVTIRGGVHWTTNTKKEETNSDMQKTKRERELSDRMRRLD